MSTHLDAINFAQHDALKRRLRAVSVTLSSIAKEAGCSLTYVSMVSQGHRRSRQIAELICNPLGETPEHLWPELYGAHACNKRGKPMK